MTFKRSISELIQNSFLMIFSVCHHQTKETCYIFSTSCNVRHGDVKEMTNLRASELLNSVSVLLIHNHTEFIPQIS